MCPLLADSERPAARERCRDTGVRFRRVAVIELLVALSQPATPIGWNREGGTPCQRSELHWEEPNQALGLMSGETWTCQQGPQR
jgi:hypothetical protein